MCGAPCGYILTHPNIPNPLNLLFLNLSPVSWKSSTNYDLAWESDRTLYYYTNNIGSLLVYVLNATVLPDGLHFDGDDYLVHVLVYYKGNYFDWHPVPLGSPVPVPQGSHSTPGTLGCDHASDALACWTQLFLDHVCRARVLHVW